MTIASLPLLMLLSLAPLSPADAGGPATALALQLHRQQCELGRLEVLLQPAHPALLAQRQRVEVFQRRLSQLLEEGHKVDRAQQLQQLNERLQQARLELDLARQRLTDAHPQLALLELQLQVELQTQQRLQRQ